MTIKKTIKKSVKPVKKAVQVASDVIYNEFGTCIACQGGKVECLHNNLAEGPGGLTCTVCGEKV